MADKLFDTVTAFGIRQEVGRRLARLRLTRNVTQEALAGEAGVAVRTLRRLEAGQPVSLENFLRVTIALGLAQELLAALPASDIRPIERVDMRGGERQRARSRKRKRPAEPWSWGE